MSGLNPKILHLNWVLPSVSRSANINYKHGTGLIVSFLDKIKSELFSQRSVLSIAILRMAFGGFVMWQAYNKGIHVFAGFPVEGIKFTYPYFEWVSGSPTLAPYLALIWFMLGFLLSVGLLFRIVAPLCFALTAYGYLISADVYLNHEYMELIYLFLLCFGPANRVLSIDSLIWKSSGTAPNFYLLALKIQTEIILIYAGIVKLNSDWLHLQPLSNWLVNNGDKIFFGHIWDNWIFVAAGAYGIIILHLFGAPLMLFRRTRLPVFIVYSGFHAINSQLFPIDIFPWMTIAVSTLFFEPDWPKRILTTALKAIGRGSSQAPPNNQPVARPPPSSWITLSALTIWFVFQLFIPMRHMLYPSWVDWSEEGTRFSWRMMLAQRSCPVFEFVIYSPVNHQLFIPDLHSVLHLGQRNAGAVFCHDSDLILQAAQQVRNYYVDKEALSPDTEVHAVILKSLNFRAPSLFVDPTIDLAKQPRQRLQHYAWIIPANDMKPLPPPYQDDRKLVDRSSFLEYLKQAGFDLQKDFSCSKQPTPGRLEGEDIFCVRK